MPLNIRSDEVDRLAGKLASQWGVSKTEAVRRALVNALRLRGGERDAVTECVRQLQDTLAAYPRTGLTADKAFYDGLNDE